MDNLDLPIFSFVVDMIGTYTIVVVAVTPSDCDRGTYGKDFVLVVIFLSFAICSHLLVSKLSELNLAGKSTLFFRLISPTINILIKFSATSFLFYIL